MEGYKVVVAGIPSLGKTLIANTSIFIGRKIVSPGSPRKNNYPLQNFERFVKVFTFGKMLIFPIKFELLSFTPGVTLFEFVST